MVSLKNGDYGAMGTYPAVWLNEKFISGKDQQKGMTLAIILRRYQNKIEISDNQNKKRASKINWAISLGILAPCSILIIYVF